MAERAAVPRLAELAVMNAFSYMREGGRVNITSLETHIHGNLHAYARITLALTSSYARCVSNRAVTVVRSAVIPRA